MILFKTILFLNFICFNIGGTIVNNQNRLWFISFDGFRWDFLQKIKLENFQWIIDNGISAKWMEPVFITKTYPTHFSMATGLYVENHGIVGNKFYDRSFQEYFTMAKGDKEAKWWSRGEPIWITATKNYIRSGVSFWPGSEVSYENVRPEHYHIYNKSQPVKSRIDEVINWFLNGTRLVNFYHSEPDTEEHQFGPNSTEVIKQLKQVDEILEYAIQQLKVNNLFKNTNIVIVSDHGHETITNVVFLNNSVEPFNISLIKRVESQGVLFSFELMDNLDLAVTNQYLDNLQTYLGSNYKLYKSREEMPDRWHYRGAIDRIPNYNVLSEPGHKLYLNPVEGRNRGGDHGYDSILSNMKPIFLAYGPDFRNMPRKIKEIHQVDLYGMTLKLFGLNDISIKNGSIIRINQIISHANFKTNQVKEIFSFLWILLTIINFIATYF